MQKPFDVKHLFIPICFILMEKKVIKVIFTGFVLMRP
jgi:uncharacterized membrane protein YhdT